MREQAKLAFETRGKMIPLVQVLPRKRLTPVIKKSARYKRMATSIGEVGIIQPLVVYPQSGKSGVFILLDGESRLEIAKELKLAEVPCIVATEYETFTYNEKVNQVSPIQEHFMVMKALKNGVSEERIAKTLNLNISSVRERTSLLEGICPEAVSLLKVKHVPRSTLSILKKVHAIKQIDMAETMIAYNNFDSSYAKALLMGTPPQLLVEPEKIRESAGVTVEEMDRMEKDMAALTKDFRRIQDTHGQNVLNLAIAQGYLKKLLNSAPVVLFLSRNYAEILEGFQKIAERTTLESCRDSALR